MHSSQLLIDGKWLASQFLLNYVTTLQRRQQAPWQDELKDHQFLYKPSVTHAIFTSPSLPAPPQRQNSEVPKQPYVSHNTRTKRLQQKQTTIEENQPENNP